MFLISFFFLIFILYTCGLSEYMFVYHTCAEAHTGQERCQILWDYGYRLLWATIWVLGTEPESSVKVTNALYCWATSSPSFFFLNEFMECFILNQAIPDLVSLFCFETGSWWIAQARTPNLSALPLKKLGWQACATNLSFVHIFLWWKLIMKITRWEQIESPLCWTRLTWCEVYFPKAFQWTSTLDGMYASS